MYFQHFFSESMWSLYSKQLQMFNSGSLALPLIRDVIRACQVPTKFHLMGSIKFIFRRRYGLPISKATAKNLSWGHLACSLSLPKSIISLYKITSDLINEHYLYPFFSQRGVFKVTAKFQLKAFLDPPSHDGCGRCVQRQLHFFSVESISGPSSHQGCGLRIRGNRCISPRRMRV